MYQHQQQHNLPYGYQQQQQLGFGPQHMPMNWLQNNNWSGGFVNGQPMPFLPPPFYYPVDMSAVTVGPSNSVRENQVPYQGRSEIPRMPPRRGILK